MKSLKDAVIAMSEATKQPRGYEEVYFSEERKTHRYNPLSMISSDPFQRLTDIQRIAHILIPDNKKADPIWQQASRKLFKVTVLYLLDTPSLPTTLGAINQLIKQPSFDNWLAEQVETTTHLDPEFYRNAYSYLNNNDAEYISKLLGMRTVRVASGSVSHQVNGASISKSYNYQAIPLLRPDEVMKLSVNQCLIMRTGFAPVKCGQFVWYLEDEMKWLQVPAITVNTIISN